MISLPVRIFAATAYTLALSAVFVTMCGIVLLAGMVREQPIMARVVRRTKRSEDVFEFGVVVERASVLIGGR